jgi:membrane-bound lytic murein transglycosylase B
MRPIVFWFFLGLCLAASGMPAGAGERPDFATWLASLRAEALARGVSRQTVDRALGEVRLIKRVVVRDRNQAEFIETTADYLKKRVSPWRIEAGAKRFADHRQTLQAVARRFGVQPRFIAAIWGVETNYGTIALSYPAIDALATLAYDPRRAKRFRAELFAALEILDAGAASLGQMKSSWGGALGQPQFMPLAYLHYAVDFDADGKKDIWSSPGDIFASIANYLKSAGWRNDQTWGRAVHVPAGVTVRLATGEPALAPPAPCARYASLGPWHDLSAFQRAGVRRLNGADLPTRSLPAALILPDGKKEDAGKNEGRGFIVYQNFCSIMRYNPAFKYALAVGLLSDEIAQGGQKIVTGGR